MYGPAPTGLVSSVPAAAAAGDGTARKFAFLSVSSLQVLAIGELRWTRTVLGFTASTDDRASISSGLLGRADAARRSPAAFTPAALNGEAAENFPPSRSVSSRVLGSGADHFVASPGAPFPSGVWWMIVSEMRSTP